MTASKYDITIEQGATFKLPLTYTAAGVPVNISGWSIRMQVRESYKHGITLDLTNANLGVRATPTLGKFVVYATDEQTAGIPFTRGVYDLELVIPAATPEVIRLLQGKVSITREVTQ